MYAQNKSFTGTVFILLIPISIFSMKQDIYKVCRGRGKFDQHNIFTEVCFDFETRLKNLNRGHYTFFTQKHSG